MKLKSVITGIRNVVILIFVFGTFLVCCGTSKKIVEPTKPSKFIKQGYERF